MQEADKEAESTDRGVQNQQAEETYRIPFPKQSSSYPKLLQDIEKRRNRQDGDQSSEEEETEEMKKMEPRDKYIKFLRDVDQKLEIVRGFNSSEIEQRIQNPKKHGEIITVHECMLNTSFADPD